jgi:thiamine-phosphate pyrophosphorylase
MPDPDLRLIVITDRNLAAPRAVNEIVRVALAAGAPAIQLRDKQASPLDLLAQAQALRGLTREHDALFFVNDRLDVALAVEADGVHLGPDDIPLAAARRAVPRGFLIGVSTDDPELAQTAEREGADYIGCGAVFGTTSKDVGGEAIGVTRLAHVASAVRIPVVGIGGVTISNVRQVAAAGARGAAVIGAVMQAPDVNDAVRALLDPFARPH